MAQMWVLLRWPKHPPAADETGGEAASSSGPSCCSYLPKLMSRLKKRGRRRRRRQAAFQCRYDPMSYALNFETTSLDEDYYRFWAFSSRFVADPNPRRVAALPLPAPDQSLTT